MTEEEVKNMETGKSNVTSVKLPPHIKSQLDDLSVSLNRKENWLPFARNRNGNGIFAEMEEMLEKLIERECKSIVLEEVEKYILITKE